MKIEVDEKKSAEFLQKYRQLLREKPQEKRDLQAYTFPDIDGQSCIDIRHSVQVKFTHAHVKERLDFLGSNFLIENEIGNWQTGEFVLFKEEDLEKLGLALLPYVSFGLLNGGSATSYLDIKKNTLIAGGDLFALYEGLIKDLRSNYLGYPKGVTPAYMNAWGEDGLSYLGLKIRHLLLLQGKYKQVFGTNCKIGFFEMLSPLTQEKVEEAYKQFKQSPYFKDVEGLEELLKTRKSAVQSLVWALDPKHIDSPQHAYYVYKDDKGQSRRLTLPAGHGESFSVLKSIYAQLEQEGYRYAYLGNIDNLGYTINLKAVALMALKATNASFEFSFKTALDKKGGILLKEGQNYTCLEIGTNLDLRTVEELEEEGNFILFNCATGLFDLSYLNKNIEQLIDRLPAHFVKQDKDIGTYIQVEQNTWEALSLLENVLILCVRKEERFLSAKVAVEMFLSCGLYRENPSFPFNKQELVSRLYRGFSQLMVDVYGMHLFKNQWHIGFKN